jgi:hypothetical protein
MEAITISALRIARVIGASGFLAWAAASSILPSPAFAQHAHHGAKAAAGDCDEPALRCATKVTPAAGPDGTLWLAFVAAGKVLVARSSDDGRTFAEPTIVSAPGEEIDWGPDARPKIAIDKAGKAFVAYAVFKDKNFNGEVFSTQSADGGKTFDKPQPITTNRESQRFEALAIDPDGRLFAAWLDKRNRVPAKARGEKYPGAALAFAWADTSGKFSETTLAQDNTCECCRLAVAFAGPARPAILFRNIFEGGIRDHAVITFTDAQTPGPVRRVGVDNWRTDACPHQGPALAIGPDGAYHSAWFTAGNARKGLFYARSGDAGASFSEPMPFGAAKRSPSRPALLATPDRLHLVWKEFDGKATTIVAMRSGNGGLSWTSPEVVASTSGDSDHPLLMRLGSRAFLSWQTQKEGYRLIALESGS